MIAQRALLQRPTACKPTIVRPRVCSVKCVAKPSGTRQQDVPVRDNASTIGLAGMGLLAPFMLEVSSALAKGGEYGILEGRSVALLHPLVMGILFTYTGYAGYLGWQWRRTRTIGDDIKALKAKVPKVAVSATDAAPAPPSPPTELEKEITSLEKERKELVAGGFRDKHFNAGSILLAGGVAIAVEGCFNTYSRTGRLFPGPHLYAGAGIVVLWALAAALVPAMQKGNEGARNAHIALNVLNMALFAWQVPTGLEIVGKVFQFTSWP